MKWLLVIFLLMSSLASASDFNVTWIPVKEDIVNKEYIITIQNLDTDMRTVDVESFFEDTNFDTSKIQDVEFYEQIVKSVTKEIKYYKTIQVPKTVSHIDNKTGMLINTTKMVNKRVLDYIEKKTVNEKVFNKQKTKILKSNKKIKEISHGKITLPSVKTKGKINNAGTKTFILKFKTPPFGSRGKVGLKINGKEYHPYWNSTWFIRKKITLTGNISEALLDRQLLLNITYEPEMNPDFSDVRFCNETDQLSAWLESKVNESYALIWIKFPYLPANGETKDYWMYYGNSEASAYWNGSMTFEFFDDGEKHSDGDELKATGGWIQGNTFNGNGTNEYSNDRSYTGDISLHLEDLGGEVYHNSELTSLPQIFECEGYVASTNLGGSRTFFGIYEGSSSWAYSVGATILAKGTVWYVGYGGTEYATSKSLVVGWHKLTIKAKSDGSADMYVDDDLLDVSVPSATLDNNDDKVAFGSYDGGHHSYIDRVRIHKYTSPEPTCAFSDAEYYVDSIYFNSSNPYYNLIDYKGDIALNHTYSSSDDLGWTAQAIDDDVGFMVTSMGSSEIDFITYENVLDWLYLVNLDNSKIYTLQNSSGNLEEHQASGNAVNFTTDLSPDDYQIEITPIPTPSPTATPTGVQPANYSGTKLSDSTIKSFYYPFMYILFIVIIIGGFMHVFGN